MPTNSSNTEVPILIDFQLNPGAYEVSLSPQDIAQKSTETLDKAMTTIQQMARRVISTIQTIPQQPSQIEVEFGIVLSMEAGALISKAGMDATINVKLTFGSKESK